MHAGWSINSFQESFIKPIHVLWNRKLPVIHFGQECNDFDLGASLKLRWVQKTKGLKSLNFVPNFSVMERSSTFHNLKFIADAAGYGYAVWPQRGMKMGPKYVSLKFCRIRCQCCYPAIFKFCRIGFLLCCYPAMACSSLSWFWRIRFQVVNSNVVRFPNCQ